MSVPSLHTAGAPRRTPPARLVEVADAIYAWTQAPGGWCLSNAGVIVGRDGAVIIDTLATESRALELAEAVRGLHPGPGRTIVNTHHHGDHTFGNRVHGAAAAVVAHEHTREEMQDTGTALTGLWPDVDWGTVDLRLPTITFRHELTLHVDERRVELIHVGPAHTTNDTVVWLPEDRVLFAGDVALNGSTPFNLMGSITGARRAVERLAALGARTIVCGHGEVAGPAVLDQTAGYLRWIQELAEAGAEAGLSPLELARETDLGEFGGLLDPERLVGNLHRAYAELEPGDLGRPLDVVAIFGEMIELNNGELPTCLA